jgi:hypothetical protein
MILQLGKNGESFDPNAPPPRTKAKFAMMEANRSEWAQWIHDKYENREHPFNGDAVSVADVKLAMRSMFNPEPSDKAVREELLRLSGDAKIVQAQQRIGNRVLTRRLIVMRNAKQWSEYGPTALYKHYEQTVLGIQT